MYLSVEKCFELDKILKSFEVAYRGHISTQLKTKYPDLNNFSIAVSQLETSIQQSPILGTKKFRLKILKIKAEVQSYYKKIEDCSSNVTTRDYNNEVPYVSELIDMVVLFYDGCFNSLSQGFSSIEEFNSSNVKYNHVRNWLSHPASSKITIEDAKMTLHFIKKIILNIPKHYFWYIPSKDIHSGCECLIGSIEDTSLKFHNLSDISFSHQKLIEREPELETLKSLLFGKESGYRKSGSLVIYGYGGVGKTALVLEFLYRIAKDINDKSRLDKIDFLLFFTSKEELLSVNETTKRLYIRDINKQITSFSDFSTKLFETLNISNIQDFEKLSGIIVIDNFETINEEEKKLFFEFIKKTPRTIQYLLTSRNEEPCEDKINLQEFNDFERGVNFIIGYIDFFGLKINLNPEEVKKLLVLSKGNTLIIVLSLQLLSNNSSIDNIFNELESVESSNIEIISDFMYKNTIGHAIDYLNKKNYKPIEILKVISLYDVPVDIYSLSKISLQSVQSTEFICEYLATKLILEKNGETFKTNDFANKFIISKYLPNRIELKRLKEKIREHQRELNIKLKFLEDSRKKDHLLNGIMEDWKPKNSIDTIAISEAYSLFGKTKEFILRRNQIDFSHISQQFEALEKMTSHPYIRFQKARCYHLIFKDTTDLSEQKKLKEIISKYYEEAIDTTDFYYPYIKNTKSYASINWIYGIFLSSVVDDKYKSLRYLEDAVQIFRRLKIRDKSYYTAINNLSWVYSKLYDLEKDKNYLAELKPLYFEIKNNKQNIILTNFDFDSYIKQFARHFRNSHFSSKSKR